MNNNSTGSSNIGIAGLNANTTGSSNIGIGGLNANTTGGSNIGIGGLDGNTTGQFNVAIGPSALAGNGSGNNALGTYALYSNLSGSYNTAIGYKAGLGDQTNVNNASYLDSNMVFIGTNASRDASVSTSTALTDGIAVGSNAHVFTSYQAVLGDDSINTTLLKGNVGIGTTTPGALLTVGGRSIIVSGSLTPNLAGIYIYAGVYNGKNYFQSGAGYIWWSSLGNPTGGYWFISPSLGVQTNDFYYTSSNPIPPAASSGWAAQNGASGSLTTSTGTGTYFTADYNGDLATGGTLSVGTTTPYSRLEVWGPDTASTSAFAVVNSASTTEFAVYDTGNAVLSGGLTQNSDQRLKTNVQSLAASSSLAAIDSLNPVSFDWINGIFGGGQQLGFIAQAVQQVFPQLVSTTSPTALTPDGTLGLNYSGLIAPIIGSIQGIAHVSGDFEANLIDWLGNASNGIQDLFATNIYATNITVNEITANELCAGSVCVSQQQRAAILAATNQAGSTPSSGQGSSGNDTGDQASSTPDTPPVIQINGDNPATVQVGGTYNDLGATITGPSADLNLGIVTYLNGTLTSPLQVDTSAPATDTIDYVATDQNGLTATSTRIVIVETATSTP